jgi:hypothetical protein
MCLAGLFGGYLVETWVTTQHQLGVFYISIAVISCLVLVVGQFRTPSGGLVQPERS